MKNKNSAAGFVIFFDNRNGFYKFKKKEILFLVIEDNLGKFDLPKGVSELYENNLETAIRETKEETGLIYLKDFYLYKNKNMTFKNDMTMFLAEYTHNDLDKYINILPNPETNIIEHVNYFWLHLDEALDNMHNYLKPVLLWAFINID